MIAEQRNGGKNCWKLTNWPSNRRQGEHTVNGDSFKASKTMTTDIPIPKRPYPLILPKQFYQVRTKYSSIENVHGTFFFQLPQTGHRKGISQCIIGLRYFKYDLWADSFSFYLHGMIICVYQLDTFRIIMKSKSTHVFKGRPTLNEGWALSKAAILDWIKGRQWTEKKYFFVLSDWASEINRCVML